MKAQNQAVPAKKKAKVKSPSSVATKGNSDDDRTGDKMTSFKGYDLKALGIPTQALPSVDGDYRGSHSYTLCIGRAVTWFVCG